ncbi:MAG: hypothetical protein ABW039_08210 [Sphingobium sp.]
MDRSTRDNLSPRQAHTPRADPLPKLLAQLILRAGRGSEIMRATSRPWASALFEGRRHVITLRIGGAQAAVQADRFAEGLDTAEWLLNGHFVADITIDERHRDEDAERIELSALTIQDW